MAVEKTEFALTSLKILIEAVDDLELPEFKGSTFRGAFGRTLKKVICIRRGQDCDSCIIKGTCAYTFIFETETYFGKDDRSLPRPFVLQMPEENKQNFASGEKFAFGLTLIGRGIDYLPYFIFAFEEMGRLGLGRRKGKFELINITDSNSGEMIYSYKDKLVKPGYKRLTINELKETADRTYLKEGFIHFVTPFRVKSEGKLTEHVTFETVIRAVLRRYKYLAEWFFHDRLVLNLHDLITEAQQVEVTECDTKWYDWQRYSFRQKEKIKLGGVIGTIGFKELSRDLWFLLVIGKELHIGKNTTFGLGQLYLSDQKSRLSSVV